MNDTLFICSLCSVFVKNTYLLTLLKVLIYFYEVVKPRLTQKVVKRTLEQFCEKNERTF